MKKKIIILSAIFLFFVLLYQFHFNQIWVGISLDIKATLANESIIKTDIIPIFFNNLI